jgi:DNA-binding NarL/FixJ family response regulator
MAQGVRRLETLLILIVEDHPLFRKGMIALLSSVPEFEVVSEAKTGEEAVVRAADLRPDVILMDLQMPEINGIEATRRILQESPSVRILVVTLFEDDDSVFMALRAGARGYVLKDSDEEEMLDSIRAVGRGEAIEAEETIRASGRVGTAYRGKGRRACPLFDRGRCALLVCVRGRCGSSWLQPHLTLVIKC